MDRRTWKVILIFVLLLVGAVLLHLAVDYPYKTILLSTSPDQSMTVVYSADLMNGATLYLHKGDENALLFSCHPDDGGKSVREVVWGEDNATLTLRILDPRGHNGEIYDLRFSIEEPFAVVPMARKRQ